MEPMLPRPKSGTKKGGRPPVVDRREIVNAIFYHLRGGSSWELLPPRLPALKTVFHHFTLWRRAVGADPRPSSARTFASRPGTRPQPATGRIDSQTVKTTRARWRPRVRRGKKVLGRSDSSSSTRWG
ncbi:MAG: transposase [Gemmataceae bacterium]